MKLKNLAAQISLEQEKIIEELDVRLFDEIDFEDITQYRESPDAWRKLIYEEVYPDKNVSETKINYRHIGEISEQKLFRRLIEEADKNGKCHIAGNGRLAIVAVNKSNVWGCYSAEAIKKDGLISVLPASENTKLCRSNFYLRVENGAVAALVNISLDNPPDIDAMEKLVKECGGYHSDVVFYACELLISKMKKNMDCTYYNLQPNNNCIFDEALVIKNPHPENNA